MKVNENIMCLYRNNPERFSELKSLKDEGLIGRVALGYYVDGKERINKFIFGSTLIGGTLSLSSMLPLITQNEFRGDSNSCTYFAVGLAVGGMTSLSIATGGIILEKLFKRRYEIEPLESVLESVVGEKEEKIRHGVF